MNYRENRSSGAHPSRERGFRFWGVIGLVGLGVAGLVIGWIGQSIQRAARAQTATAVAQALEQVYALRTAQAAKAIPTLTPTQTATEQTFPTATIVVPQNPAPGATRLRAGDEMRMVGVPAGDFEMGSEVEGNYEKPVHTVYLDGYWIDQTEVTNAQYARCVQAGACSAPASNSSRRVDGYFDDPAYADYPVIWVSWEQAQEYCNWAGARLPTEAEWEKAARGTDGRSYPWGEGIDCERANYGFCVGDTVSVGSYPKGASPYGALDMAGNVWEWVADWFTDGYPQSPRENPSGPASGNYRVLRGGSWFDDGFVVRSSYRLSEAPLEAYNNLGFRCAAKW